MKEHKRLEFKSTITNTFLKTVSAYSNFYGGEIVFGVNDDGSVCGIDNPDQVCLDIENRINDSISPKPDFEIDIDDSKKIIRLIVREGQYKPYLYKGKAYRRSDTASIEVDQAELKELVLQGSNLYFEELPCGKDDLLFQELSAKLMKNLDIKVVSEDILRTLGLFTKDKKFNNAAALLSDENDFYGIDIARFGNSINEIMDRETISKASVLKQYDAALNMIKRYYQYEEISEIERKKVDLVPEIAYREAIANALIYRDWSINSHIRISLFSDKIEIKSPGGLPRGITAEEYMKGDISCLRNPILGNVFFRLHYIEMFGTGVRRILLAYKDAKIKPKFEITDNVISVILPVTEDQYHVTNDEAKVMSALENGEQLSSSEIAKVTGYTKSKVLRLIEHLKEKDYIKIIGNGRGTKYSL
ncbi:MAG: putative DNA binding domain-containing protein [Eubacterium sp.]|nr:putative DNA binding domain-containing protein [Eubacterium sp.]